MIRSSLSLSHFYVKQYLLGKILFKLNQLYPNMFNYFGRVICYNFAFFATESKSPLAKKQRKNKEREREERQCVLELQREREK